MEHFGVVDIVERFAVIIVLGIGVAVTDNKIPPQHVQYVLVSYCDSSQGRGLQGEYLIATSKVASKQDVDYHSYLCLGIVV